MVVNHLNPLLKKYANGVVDQAGRFYPYRTAVLIAGDASIPARANARYFIKTVTISYSTLVTDAGTTVSVAATVLGQTIAVAYLIKTTLVVNLASQEFPVDVLTDKNTAVTMGATTITSPSATVVYAIVDDLG